MKEVYNGLPLWAKGVVVVGGALLGFIVVKSILNKIKATADLKDQMKVRDSAANEIKNLYNQGIKQTLTNAQLESMSVEMAQSFAGCGYKIENIKRLFDRLQNEADLQAFLRIYGVRKYDGCNWEMNWGDSEFNLSSALADELKAFQISEINAILGKKGIKFRF
jgi:hypothetical protein